MIRPHASADAPVVAAVCRAAIISEALRATLDGVAVVRTLPAGTGDTAGLLRSVKPQAIVVDCEDEAGQAVDYAREAGLPLVQVSLRGEALRVFGGDGWAERDDADDGAIRRILLAAIYGTEAP
jgi:pyridoxal biosynthesis lyase PdxS